MTESPTSERPSALSDQPLRLLALDTEDLMVLSAHLQDASLRRSDMTWRPRERRFVLVARRLDRMCGLREVRRLAGFHLERVTGVRHLGFSGDEGRALSLQAVTFHPGQAPAGTVMLGFADGAAIRVEVECLEAALSDIGELEVQDGIEAGQP